MSVFASIEEKVHAVLIGVDDAVAAAIFDDQTDLTISSRCGMALMDHTAGAEGVALRALAEGLDDIQKQHCIGAIQADYARAQAVIAKLQPYVERLSHE